MTDRWTAPFRPPEPIWRADRWRTNAHLIDEVRQLHWEPGQSVVDVTYGEGGWWTIWRPDGLIGHDRYVGDGVDYGELPEADGTVDVLAYDPPYVGGGGYDTSTIKTFRERYGIHAASVGHAKVLAEIVRPFPEFARVLRPAARGDKYGGGRLWFKGMNYVVGGQYRTVAYDALQIARADGWRLVDEFYYVNSGGAQPRECRRCRGACVRPAGTAIVVCDSCAGTGWQVQHHARANVSILFVLAPPPVDFAP